MEMGLYLKMDDTNESEPFLWDEMYTENKSSISIASDAFILSDTSLPPRGRLLRFARCAVLGVYSRIFLAVFIINIWEGHRILTMKRRSKYSPLLIDISTKASANMLVAILIRQDYIINSLFRLRRSLAKMYEYGGLHSGAAVCSVLWFTLLSYILTWEFITIRIADPLIIICTFTIISILWAMLITAYPAFRSQKHNTFENIHRFGGWAVLGLFFPELYLFTRALGHQAGPASPGAVLTKLPAFWLLIASAFHVALPWLRL
jgi:hypothetical protein